MPHAPQHAWYRQGIVWLGAAVFAASIAGSLWLIRVAERYADPPLPAAELPPGPKLLRMPIAREAASPSATTSTAPAAPR